jgi:hypothetical protein
MKKNSWTLGAAAVGVLVLAAGGGWWWFQGRVPEVKAGQLIALIDPETFEYRVRQSQATSTPRRRRC